MPHFNAALVIKIAVYTFYTFIFTIPKRWNVERSRELPNFTIKGIKPSRDAPSVNF